MKPAGALSYRNAKGSVNTAWCSIKRNLRKRRSLPKSWRKQSPTRSPEKKNEKNGNKGKAKWPDDPEESLFCDSLMALMRQCERYNYLAPSDPPKPQTKSSPCPPCSPSLSCPPPPPPRPTSLSSSPPSPPKISKRRKFLRYINGVEVQVTEEAESQSNLNPCDRPQLSFKLVI